LCFRHIGERAVSVGEFELKVIERGIERRSARVWAPRWIGPMLYLRGVLQPLSERRVQKNEGELVEAIRLSDESGESRSQDPLLGVAAKALE